MNDTGTPRTVTVRAPAKINLQLSVGPLGEDGYHPLATVFQAVSLWDTVTARVRDDDAVTCVVEARADTALPEGSVPTDETNLAVRAARALAAAHSVERGADIRIVKGIPVAGGMAGGSADAAAALVACADLWGLGLARDDLGEIAADLGSDVPFALHGHTAIGLGRGDSLAPAMTRGELHWVVATQEFGLSTRDVYAEFDRREGIGLGGDPEVNDELMAALRAGDPVEVGRRLSNDLAAPALRLRPELRLVLDAAREAEAFGAIVSGSGPTVVALAGSAQHAHEIAGHVRAARCADVVHVARGPVTGATIVAEDEA